MADISAILTKYIELRDRKAELGKKQAEEMTPINEAMGNIENYLMHVMNQQGVTQLKVEGTGTAFKATATSCQLQDPMAFKDFIFSPAADAIINYLASAEVYIDDSSKTAIANIIRDLPRWDMVDFRAGKKGITEYVDNEATPVPGVVLNTIATVNIRRA